jgi:CDP-diacylglycerol pyrophosphatase
VLKDRRGDTQFLLIPTTRITGIEDPKILESDTPNYFAEAWKNIGFVSTRARAPLSRDKISLAINAVPGRTQDQLHIHMDCIRPDVRTQLRRLVGGIGRTWAPLPEPVDGHVFNAMHIDGETLGNTNPFRLLAAVPGAAAEMGRHTLVLVGEDFADASGTTVPGFVLLDGRADEGIELVLGFRGDGESLQDHACILQDTASR